MNEVFRDKLDLMHESQKVSRHVDTKANCILAFIVKELELKNREICVTLVQNIGEAGI